MRLYKAARPAKQKQYTTVSGMNWRQKLKQEVLDHYGRECACCGDPDHRRLTIDHIAGGGRQHRESGMDGHHHIGRFLKANGWPPGYQTLCWSCNSVKHFWPNEPCHTSRVYP